MTGRIGRRTSFEVTVNGQLVHSKLKSGGFPDKKEVVSIIKEVAAGEDPKPTQKSISTCTIL